MGLFRLKKMGSMSEISSEKVMVPIRLHWCLLKLGGRLLFWAFCVSHGTVLSGALSPVSAAPAVAAEALGATTLPCHDGHACSTNPSQWVERGVSTFSEV